MLDHLGFAVADYARSRAFYDVIMPILGASLIMEVTKEQSGGYEGAGYGRDGQPQFWIGIGCPLQGSAHIAFTAPTRAMVDAFYTAAIAAGAKDNGAPGLRPHYHANYYGAFVFDPDGHNIEAVCHLPE